jgi:hypothetical protein
MMLILLGSKELNTLAQTDRIITAFMYTCKHIYKTVSRSHDTADSYGLELRQTPKEASWKTCRQLHIGSS